jgi:hypothetical protein
MQTVLMEGTLNLGRLDFVDRSADLGLDWVVYVPPAMSTDATVREGFGENPTPA